VIDVFDIADIDPGPSSFTGTEIIDGGFAARPVSVCDQRSDVHWTILADDSIDPATEALNGAYGFSCMTVAFALSGGSSLGSIQVGVMQALAAEGITPDLLVGTSAGAINASWVAGGRPLDGLAEVWATLHRRDIFPLHPTVGLRAFMGRSDHFIPNTALRRMLRRLINFRLLEDAQIPVMLIATDAVTGDEVRLTAGPAVPAVLASAAIPGVFPPVEIEGRQLVDGGVVNNTPITAAIDAGATEVYVLSTGFACTGTAVPKGAIAAALNAVGFLVQQRLIMETERRTYPVPVHLVPAPCPLSVSPVDFSQGADLTERARERTGAWLKAGRPPARPAALHRHS
jgi:NTE family protein